MIIKRTFDLILAGLVVVVSSPFWLVAAILIKATSPGPVFFRQERIGKNGVRYTMIKFRTMTVGVDGTSLARENDPRITSIGKRLRDTSLDELPQLINVLKGEMSVVGPRPALPEMIPYYTPAQSKRLGMKPGLTGLAQVKGSYDLPPEQKVQYDLQYMRTMGPVADTRLMLSSVLNTLLRRWDQKEH